MARTSPGNAELVKRLAEDHALFREYIASIRDLLPKARTRAIRRRIAGRIRTYARLHKEHMRVVDEELLPQVHKLLPEAERSRILKTFVEVEEREIGWGMKEAYTSIIRRLVDAYPK